MAFKYEKVTDDVRRQKIDLRLQVLEDRRVDTELDEFSPSTSPMIGTVGGARGVFDPATGATLGSGEAVKSVLEQIDEEIAALRAERDKLPKPTTTGTTGK